jgi:hypothetical protein
MRTRAVIVDRQVGDIRETVAVDNDPGIAAVLLESLSEDDYDHAAIGGVSLTLDEARALVAALEVRIAEAESSVNAARPSRNGDGS